MRTVTPTMSCVLIGLMLALMGPPVSRADDDGFVTAVQSLGFVQGDANLIATARSSCYFLSRNRDPSQVLDRIVRYTRVEPESARQFFALTITEYCPQYAGAAGA